MRDTSSPQHRGLFVAQTGFASPLLRPYFLPAAVDFASPFCAGIAGSRGITFESNCSVQDISACRKMQEARRERLETKRL
jgi:hypothetical protein